MSLTSIAGASRSRDGSPSERRRAPMVVACEECRRRKIKASHESSYVSERDWQTLSNIHSERSVMVRIRSVTCAELVDGDVITKLKRVSLDKRLSNENTTNSKRLTMSSATSSLVSRNKITAQCWMSCAKFALGGTLAICCNRCGAGPRQEKQV